MMREKVFVLLAVFLVLASHPSQFAVAQGTCDPNAAISRVSVDGAGVQANFESYLPFLSGDGRLVTFTTSATNLVAGDTNATQDVYAFDRTTCTPTRISISTGGAQSSSPSGGGVISADASVVGFVSQGSELVAGDTNSAIDAFVRNRILNQTTRVSLGTGSVQANGPSVPPVFSGDGRYAVFSSLANNLVSADTNGVADIFIRDRNTGTTTRILGTGSVQPNGSAGVYTISDDGRYIAFASEASNLVAGDTNGHRDIFLYDRTTAALTKVTPDIASPPGVLNYSVDLSSDGRYLAFSSNASNVVASDTNSVADAFVFDRTTAQTTRVSVSSANGEGDGESIFPSISGDGRFVVFLSSATNLVAGDTNGFADVFLRDRLLNTTERVSVDASGTQANGASEFAPAISANGAVIAFDSVATNLVANDTNNASDIFVVNRVALLNDGNMLTNGDFAADMTSWIPFGAPTQAAIQYQITGGVFEFYRAAGTQQAVVLQNTGFSLNANSNFEASLSLGNSSAIRKRITVLVHDGDFSDLQVCTFWLPPSTPLGSYRMTARTTEAWTNASISIYASSADGQGWAQLDNVALKALSGPPAGRTMCYDPLVTTASPSADSANLLTNGDFASGFNSWINYGTPTVAALNYQVTGGVLEFSRNTGTQSAVVYQNTGDAVTSGAHLEVSFSLGNSSAQRKRATILVHEGDFTDLHVCTFWLAPNAPLATYTVRTYATKAWTNATLSVYASTADAAGWYLLDNVVYRTRPSTTIVGTECYLAGAVPADDGSLLPEIAPTVEEPAAPVILPSGELPLIATPQPLAPAEAALPQEGSAGSEFGGEGG
jgi:hypothetical protein